MFPSARAPRAAATNTIEVVLIRLDSRGRSKPLLDELQALHDRRVVNLVDAIVIEKEGAESVRATSTSGLSARGVGRIRRMMRDAIGFEHTDDSREAPEVHFTGSGVLLGARDVASIAAMLEPRQSAVAIIIEHKWASRLGKLMHSTGLNLLEDYMLTPDILRGTGTGISMW